MNNGSNISHNFWDGFSQGMFNLVNSLGTTWIKSRGTSSPTTYVYPTPVVEREDDTSKILMWSGVGLLAVVIIIVTIVLLKK